MAKIAANIIATLLCLAYADFIAAQSKWSLEIGPNFARKGSGIWAKENRDKTFRRGLTLGCSYYAHLQNPFIGQFSGNIETRNFFLDSFSGGLGANCHVKGKFNLTDIELSAGILAKIGPWARLGQHLSFSGRITEKIDATEICHIGQVYDPPKQLERSSPYFSSGDFNFGVSATIVLKKVYAEFRARRGLINFVPGGYAGEAPRTFTLSIRLGYFIG